MSGVRFDVSLPLRNSADLDRLIQNQNSPSSPEYHQFLTPAQFRAAYGPTESDLMTVGQSLQNAGMQVNYTSQGVGAVGTLQSVERYFDTQLRSTRSIRGNVLESVTPLKIPQELKRVGASVSPFTRLQVNLMHAKTAAVVDPQNRYSPVGPYWFDDLKQAYRYPSYQTVTGAGRKIAVVMASDFNPADMQNYFGHEGLAVPTIVSRPVDGGAPFDPNSGSSFEDELDIQQSGGMAPGATIINYNMPDLSIVPSTLDAYTAVVDDNQADVVNSSFGLCELDFTAAYNGGQDFTYLFNTFHDIFRQGNAQGITFVASSGDFGALGCTNTAGTQFIFGISWPANDPNVTAVGGTNLVTVNQPGSRNSAYVSENANDDPLDPAQVGATGGVWGSGGGISTFWPKPAYQLLVNTGSRMRTNPDLALHMGGCPNIALQPCGPNRSFDIEAFAGQFFGVVGTSASSPDFVGLL
ncbi:MAG: peptidase S53, partial [Candidatus Eremiobacteraeota bacterium]|nr:peptidase S53 [Candidatus Eremiobacteraeota bacterium]MBV8355338.1 peptidase S53 [Candidatus Eremiobacteraeota bacterium]